MKSKSVTEQFEKVRKGMECCIKRQPYTCGEMCPYHDDAICVMKLRQDALALIRQQQERIAELEAAQTARVMTPEEVAAVPDGSVIWEEIKSTGICEAMIRDSNLFANGPDFLALDDVLDCDDYLKNYRCWTQRPTDEQREAVPWNE